MAMTFGAGVPKSGMMEIGIALVLHDRFTNQAGQASSAIRRLQQDARLAVQQNLQAAANLGTMGAAAFTAIAAGVRDMVEYGAEYVDLMTTVGAITDASIDRMSQLNDLALSLGRETMFSSQDIASGMKYLAMAGNTAEQIQGMIRGAAYAAGATGMELGGKGGAADVITNVMRTFQLRGEKAANWVGDVMTNATLSANISMTDLAASIRYAAADMTNLGYTLPEVSAAIGTLGNMGIQGSMAGTALANMARYLNRSISDPSYKGHKYLEQLGLTREQLLNSDGTLRSLYEIITLINNATANMDPSQRNLFTTGIFGVRGNRAAMALMRDTEGFMSLYQDLMGTGQGYAKSIVEKRMETIAGQINIVKSTWQNLKVTFTQSMEKYFVPLLKFVTNILSGIQKILSTGAGRFLTFSGIAVSALIGIGGAFITLRAKLLMFQTDSTISARNMFAVLTTGWKTATIQATEYARIERMILAQRRAGLFGTPGGILVGGTYKKIQYKDKYGNPQTRYYNMETKRVASRAEVGKFAKGVAGVGAGAAVGKIMGKTLPAATRIGGKLLSFGGNILKFFGGWWGLALTVGIPAIIGLIGAIGKNKDATGLNQASTDSNTDAVNALTGQYQKQKEEEATKEGLTKEQLVLAVNLLGQLVRGQKTKEPVQVNIRMPDGSIQTLSMESGDDFDENEWMR